MKRLRFHPFRRAMLSLAALILCGATAAHAVTCPDTSTHIAMESGSYSSQQGVLFVLHHFAATMIPLGKTSPTCLEKLTQVSHADIFVSNESLTRVFARKLDSVNSDIRDLKIVHGFGTVTISGEMEKMIPIKFSIEGPVSTDGTLLSMKAEKINADGIPMKMLLGVVGKHLSSVLGMKGVNGVQVEGDTMSFSPEKVAHLRGYIASVQTTPQGLTLHYARKPGAHAAALAKVARPGVSPS